MHVLDTPPYSIHQNAMSRDEIVSQLMNQVNSGKVTITLGEVTVKPSLQMQSMNDTCSPSTPSKNDTCSPSTPPKNNTCSPSTPSKNDTCSPSTPSKNDTCSPSTSSKNDTCSPGMQSRNCTCSPSKEEDSDGVAAGVVAGLSIALFFVGILIGIGLTLFLQWLVKGKISKYNVSYNKQRDEVIN